MTPQKFGRYEIKAELGRGGMAVVYRAYDARFKRDVALKVLPSQLLGEAALRTRFEREAQMIASLEHPAIVPVYDFGDEEGQPYLVMRYMPGGSLADRLEQGPMSSAETLHIISRLASALDQVHAHGIVHRDLKPANVLFDQYGEAYLSDFGIARLSESSASLTGESIVGTPAYMSPEQGRGEPDIDGRTDLYALGVILFQMLAGKQPYQATTPIGVVMKHITEPIPSLREARPDLPYTFDQVIGTAMAKERSERFPTGSDLLSALEVATRLAEESGESAPPSRPPEQTPPPASVQSLKPPSNPGIPAVKPPDVVKPPDTVHPPDAANPAAEIKSATAVRPARAGSFSLVFWIGAGLTIFIVLCVVGAAAIGIGAQFLPQVTAPRAETPGEKGNESASPSTETPQISAPQATATALPPAATQPDGVTDTAPAASTEDTPLPPSKPQAPGALLFQDDFSNPKSGWPRQKKDSSYSGDGYQILVNDPNAVVVAVPGLSLTDAVIDVEVSKVAGPDRNWFGIVCRYQNDKNFYFLVISSDGRYGIGRFVNGEKKLLNADEMQPDAAIHQGTTSNRLSASCIGNTLALTVNGSPLASVQDAAFASGDVGLLGGAFEIHGANLLFDNFLATAP